MIKRVAVLGEGQLAADTCGLTAGMDGWVLDAVVPNKPAPYWDVVLTGVVVDRWPETRLVRSGDWRELELGRYDVVLCILYNREGAHRRLPANPQLPSGDLAAVSWRSPDQLGVAKW